jgi:NAD(P)-dependent dehydrogenase (short-subunit alcohol dehydrogenase family)
MTERTLETVQARAGLDREHALSAVLATVGQERLITPEEVADAVRSLCLPDSGGVTGQAIVLPMKVAS